jgi:predicted GNAT family acetyltransferase
VQLRTHADVDSFLDAAGPLLLRDEARHNLIFGICTTLVDAPAAYPGFRLWTVESGGESVVAALMTPPFNLVVAQPADAAAVRFAAEALVDLGVDLPGVTGAVPEADLFAESWQSLTGAGRQLRMSQGVYAARTAQPPEDVAGELRFASADDRQLLVDWTLAFESEALPEDAPRHDVEQIVDRRLASKSGGTALWDHDGQTVSLSGFGGGTPHGIRIGPVYTPPQFRRRGYASALVGQLSRHLLDGGREYCFLYTDLANPTSNRIYMNVGYELVCESADYVFQSASPA